MKYYLKKQTGVPNSGQTITAALYQPFSTAIADVSSSAHGL
jgi:hypothetical protein